MYPSNKKIFRPNQADGQLAPKRNPMAGLPPELLELLQQKQKLAKRIDIIQKRLVLAFSEPLNTHYVELMKEDMVLSCKITDILATLERKRR